MSIAKKVNDSWGDGLLYDEHDKMRSSLPLGGFYIRAGAARILKAEIVWGQAMPPYPVSYDQSTFTLLQDFLALADGTTDDLCEFAKRYGPLNGLSVRGGERESMEDWRHCIEIVKGILTVASKVQDGQLAPDRDWALLPGTRPPAHSPSTPRTLTLSVQKLLLSTVASRMVERWGVFPRVTWNDSGVHFGLGGATLLSGIGAQLLCAICRSDSFVFCSNCGKPYPPKRKPRAGNHFCSNCGKKAARKFAQRKFTQGRISAQRKGKRK